MTKTFVPHDNQREAMDHIYGLTAREHFGEFARVADA